MFQKSTGFCTWAKPGYIHSRKIGFLAKNTKLAVFPDIFLNWLSVRLSYGSALVRRLKVLSLRKVSFLLLAQSGKKGKTRCDLTKKKAVEKPNSNSYEWRWT